MSSLVQWLEDNDEADDDTCRHHSGNRASRRLEADDRAVLSELIQRWKTDTRHLSWTIAKVAHPGYLRIISFGHSALPALLAEMTRDPDHWFAALRAITGQDPVPEDLRGDLPRMTAVWLEWGRENLPGLELDRSGA
jgi:hypothetical protein